jgi:hypothetical protein
MPRDSEATGRTTVLVPVKELHSQTCRLGTQSLHGDGDRLRPISMLTLAKSRLRLRPAETLRAPVHEIACSRGRDAFATVGASPAQPASPTPSSWSIQSTRESLRCCRPTPSLTGHKVALALSEVIARVSAVTMLSSMTIEVDSPKVSRVPLSRVIVKPLPTSLRISSLRRIGIAGVARSCCPRRLTTALPFTAVIEPTGSSAIATGSRNTLGQDYQEQEKPPHRSPSRAA